MNMSSHRHLSCVTNADLSPRNMAWRDRHARPVRAGYRQGRVGWDSLTPIEPKVVSLGLSKRHAATIEMGRRDSSYRCRGEARRPLPDRYCLSGQCLRVFRSTGADRGTMISRSAPPARATLRDVFAVREFRVLWSSVILSAVADRLALVALAVLVYDRTRSPLLAAVAYAAGYLPWAVGGLFLSNLADRRPRRTVMVACDAVRAILVAAMTVPGMPVTALVLLLFAATMFVSPFEPTRASVTPGVLPGERYALGTAVMETTYLTAGVAGTAAGGAAVALLGVQPSLLIDAATFVASGLLIGLGTRARPAADRAHGNLVAPLVWAAALRLVFGDRTLRTLVLLG
jgi:Major Facilitator Superfamily